MTLGPNVRRLFQLPSTARGVDREIDDELAFHLDARVDDLVARGMAADAAREQALREFGDVSIARAELGEVDRRRLRRRGRAEWWEGVRQDVRFAARGLRRQPAVLAVTMLTLALGIGATTAIFSVVDRVMLRPLAFPRADRIVVLHERGADGAGEMRASAPNVTDWRALGHRLSGIAAFGSSPTTVLGGAEPVRVTAAAVSDDFFRVMGVQPAMGRGFTAEERRTGGPAAAVVSDRYWRDQLGADARATDGRTIEIDGRVATVVGVMPAGFAFPDESDVWVPLDLDASGEDRTAHNWDVVARLRDGATPQDAAADLSAVQRGVKQRYGRAADANAVAVTTLLDDVVGPAQHSLLLLFAASGLVLLVACTNVASTLLARGASRYREIAIRAALGASRARVVRQLFTESVLLALLGGVAGLATAALALRLLAAVAPAGALPRLAEIRLDGWAVAFAVLAAGVAAVIFGLLPALRVADGGARDALVTRGVAPGGRSAGWSALVAGEVAMAVLLLVGAGLLVRSFTQLLRIDPGFRTENVLAAQLSLPESKYPGDTAVAALYDQLLPDLAALPGVAGVGLVSHLPLSGAGLNGAFEIEGRGPRSGYASYRAASAGYFGAMGIALRRGRLFGDDDRAGGTDVAVVSQALADRYWPGADPVGMRIRDLANDSFHYGRERWLTIVGVVADVRDGGLTAKPAPTVYVSYRQRPFRARDAVVAVASGSRSSSAAAALAEPVRRRLRERYASVPVELRTMDAQLAGVLARRRFTTTMLGMFAGVALALAIVGIYGVVSYRVSQRTQEIGIRVALGATTGQVRRVVIGDAMKVVVAGLIVGIVGAIALTRLMAGLLYGTSPTDLPTFAGALALLFAAGLLASWLPARRATRVDPLVALRAG